MSNKSIKVGVANTNKEIIFIIELFLKKEFLMLMEKNKFIKTI
jgi:hypothetical protein